VGKWLEIIDIYTYIYTCFFSTPGIQKRGKLASFGVDDMFFFSTPGIQKMKKIE